jgi:hypothetical protein
MILGRFKGGRASSVSPVIEETAVVTADCPPTNPETASAVVLLPTKSLTDRSSLKNRRPDSTVPGFEVTSAPGRLRLDNEPPKLLWPNKP